jgi:hypothetical protein
MLALLISQKLLNPRPSLSLNPDLPAGKEKNRNTRRETNPKPFHPQALRSQHIASFSSYQALVEPV